VFSPLGTALTTRREHPEQAPRTHVAMTQDHQWLGTAVRLLKTAWEIPRTRICVVSDVLQGDHALDGIGTIMHYVPLARWVDEVREAKVTAAVEEMAKQYAIESREIAEPEFEDLIRAAQNYVVARRIMEAEGCQGISVDCAQLVGECKAACGPCLAWSRLLDEGSLGGCEADTEAAVSLLLAGRLFDRPGFMQDPAPNTVRNSIVASHCTCATRLDGFDKPPAQYSLRTHYESDTGVALRVLWREGQEITLLKYQRPGKMVFGSGRVVENVQVTAGGGCRTAVEIALDGVPDVRQLRGNHQVLVYGNFEATLRGFCELSGLEMEHV
jgi:L-fucose isomerase-like protein